MENVGGGNKESTPEFLYSFCFPAKHQSSSSSSSSSFFCFDRSSSTSVGAIVLLFNMMAADTPSTGKTWELSPYELNRKPQEVITNETEIAVAPRSLHNELMCPICLDMLKDTMTTKECLHRFCHDCIITALRSGNKECPTCRKKLISKRSLRPDPNFDMLIMKIHPNREEYEADQDKFMASLHKQTLNVSLESLRLQALNRSHSKIRKYSSFDRDSLDRSTDSPQSPGEDSNGLSKRPKSGNFESEAGDLDDDTEMSSINSSPSESDPIPLPEIELVFQPLSPDSAPANSSLTTTRYLKTTTNATVEHLVKYLSMRHILENKNNNIKGNNDVKDTPPESLFTLYVSTGRGQFQPLVPSMTLDQVREEYFSHERSITIHYGYKVQVVRALGPDFS